MSRKKFVKKIFVSIIAVVMTFGHIPLNVIASQNLNIEKDIDFLDKEYTITVSEAVFDGITYIITVKEDSIGNREVQVESNYTKAIVNLSSPNFRAAQLLKSRTYIFETGKILENFTFVSPYESTIKKDYNENGYVSIIPFNQTINSLYWDYSVTSVFVNNGTNWTLSSGRLGTVNTPPPSHNTNSAQRNTFASGFRTEVQTMRNAQANATAILAGSVTSGILAGIVASMGSKVGIVRAAVIGTLTAVGAALTSVDSWMTALTARERADYFWWLFRNI